MTTKIETHTCERCLETLNPKTAKMLELNSRTNLYSDPEVAPVTPASDSQGGFYFGRDCARAVLGNGGRLERIDPRSLERARAENRAAAKAPAGFGGRVGGTIPGGEPGEFADRARSAASVFLERTRAPKLYAAAAATLDAFDLDDKSGFTPAQRRALETLRKALGR